VSQCKRTAVEQARYHSDDVYLEADSLLLNRAAFVHYPWFDHDGPHLKKPIAVTFKMAVQRCIALAIARLVHKVPSKAIPNPSAHEAILCLCDNFMKMRMMEVANPCVKKCQSYTSTLKAKLLGLLNVFVAAIDKRNRLVVVVSHLIVCAKSFENTQKDSRNQ
jgi:hypothetical protein